MRLLVALALVAATLTGCGSREPAKPIPGTSDHPLVAESETAGASSEGQAKPNYDKLLEGQKRRAPKSRFTPCNLVTRGEARDILGETLQTPVEAPQGPTCIYRTQSGEALITLAVEPLRFDRVTRRMRGAKAVNIADRSAICGLHGSARLYVPLRRGRVLSVAAPCAVASRFAARALPRLDR